MRVKVQSCSRRAVPGRFTWIFSLTKNLSVNGSLLLKWTNGVKVFPVTESERVGAYAQ
jgi:hypothetical protein